MSAVSTLTLYSVYLLPCPSWFHTMTMLDGVSVGRGQKGEEFLRDLMLLRRRAYSSREDGDDLNFRRQRRRSRRCPASASIRSVAGSPARLRRARRARPPARRAAPARCAARWRRRCPSARTGAPGARHSGPSNSRCCARPERRRERPLQLPMSGRGARRPPRSPRPSARGRPGCPDRPAGCGQPIDRIGREHDKIEQLAVLNPPGRVDAADRFDRHRMPRPPLVRFDEFGQHLARRHRRDAGDRLTQVARGPYRTPRSVDVAQPGLLQRLAHVVHVQAEHAGGELRALLAFVGFARGRACRAPSAPTPRARRRRRRRRRR